MYCLLLVVCGIILPLILVVVLTLLLDLSFPIISLYLPSLATFICRTKRRIVPVFRSQAPRWAMDGWMLIFKDPPRLTTRGGMDSLMNRLAMHFMQNGTGAWSSVPILAILKHLLSTPSMFKMTVE